MGNLRLHHEHGFTLIELSIVLVILGLIVGGVLVGQDLIRAAEVRATISQIEKYQTAVNTFRGKYGGLPGDLRDPDATRYGFLPRGQYAGEGDGNGVLEGNCVDSAGNNFGTEEGCGESVVLWNDLVTAHLIDGYAGAGGAIPSETSNTAIIPQAVFPAAKLGQSNFVYAYSAGGINYFAISSVAVLGWFVVGGTNPNVAVQQAYNIDRKIDDGLPQSGNVTACYLNFNVHSFTSSWAAGNSLEGANGGVGNCIPSTAATPYLSTNCYDNNNSVGSQAYSLLQNGNKPNCALSFKFQ